MEMPSLGLKLPRRCWKEKMRWRDWGGPNGEAQLGSPTLFHVSRGTWLGGCWKQLSGKGQRSIWYFPCIANLLQNLYCSACGAVCGSWEDLSDIYQGIGPIRPYFVEHFRNWIPQTAEIFKNVSKLEWICINCHERNIWIYWTRYSSKLYMVQSCISNNAPKSESNVPIFLTIYS